MSWTVSRDALERGARAALDRVRDERVLDRLERAARGVRWLDRVEESRRLFHEAALARIERSTGGGHWDGEARSQAAGYFALAGTCARMGRGSRVHIPQARLPSSPFSRARFRALRW